jgi:acyl-ACP thioesterase
MEVSRHPFKIHSFDTDAFGALTAPGLLGYLLEASGRSADRLGFGIEKLQTQNLTWVIARIGIVLHEAVTFGEQIEVETWPAGLMRSASTRDFRIWKGAREIGQATSLWFVLDMETRMPQRAHSLLPEHLHAATEHPLTLSRSVSAIAGTPEIERTFDVRLADIDLNQHVTASSYVAWAMEAVPQAVWASNRLTSLDVQFLEECHYGHQIVTASVPIDDTNRLHRVSRSTDGREIARLHTTWAKRTP